MRNYPWLSARKKTDDEATNVASRLVSGAYILHSGMDKWSSSPQQATGIHAMASDAFPVVTSIEAAKFLRALSAAEITTGPGATHPVRPGRYCGCLADRLLRRPGSDVPAYPLAAQIGQHLAKPPGDRCEQRHLDARHRAGPAHRRGRPTAEVVPGCLTFMRSGACTGWQSFSGPAAARVAVSVAPPKRRGAGT